jgi:hypothetical protein
MESTCPSLTPRIQPSTLDPHSQVVDYCSDEDCDEHENESGFGVVLVNQLTQRVTLRKENKPSGDCGKTG